MSALQQSVRRIARTASTTPGPDAREHLPMRIDVREIPSARSEQIRNRNMQLMNEALARAQMRERLALAERDRKARAVIRARRAKKRAERAGFRARRVLAALI